MIDHHFMEKNELEEWLSENGETDENRARALTKQIEDRSYNPPRRERILQWQKQQDFPICPNPDDPDACNVYNELQFPDDVYQDIQEYQEKRQNS